MALIDKASLLMVPSTYEAGKLYNVLPSGNRAPDNKGGAGYDQTRADFDFDRGSNAAATRIGSDGLIKKYRENLYTESNNFSDSDWLKSSSMTLTSGQSGYDGTNDAWLLSKGSSQYKAINQQISNTSVKTLSVYAKANTNSNICLFVSSNPSNFYQDFDLSNGSLGAGSNGAIATSIDSVGNGWYRCSVVFNGATTSADIFPDTISGANAGNILIQNAQLETGLCSTDYLNSTSVTAKSGVLIDLPRINFDANGENGALLLEPSRLNAVQFSEYFGTWTNVSNATITHNSLISPEGVKNAAYLQFSNANQSINLNSNLATGVICTASVYVKGTAGETIRIAAGGADSPNLTLSGEWQRLEHTATSLNSSININTYGGATARNVYIYGAMLEPNASYVSSYIPNHGTSGGVTRAADSCSVTGASDVIGQTEGTLFLDITGESLQEDSRYMAIGNYADSTNRLLIYQYSNVINVYCGAGTPFNMTHNPSSGRLKIAVGYSAGDYAFYVNGVQAGLSNNSGVPTCSEVSFGLNEITTATLPPSIGYNQAALFNERLTNAELATLTTL